MRTLRCFVLLLPLLAVLALPGCDGDPVGSRVSTVDLTFRYSSQIGPGSVGPEVAGSCYHHRLGSVWLHLEPGFDDTVQLFSVAEKVYQGSTLVPVMGATSFRVTIGDLECCTYAEDEPCWPTRGLEVNGVPVERAVAMSTEVFPDRMGVEFRVDTEGRVTP